VAVIVSSLLIFGLGSLHASPANASNTATHGIDVRFTIVSNGYFVGSGSYYNWDNTYGQVCVRSFGDDGSFSEQFSVRCVSTPQGGGFTFSTPPPLTPCGIANGISAEEWIFTRVKGYDHGKPPKLLDVKVSNSIENDCSGTPPEPGGNGS